MPSSPKESPEAALARWKSEVAGDVLNAAMLLEEIRDGCDPTTERPKVRGAIAILTQLADRLEESR